MLVAGNLNKKDLNKLAVELIGLCAVHTIILALLMVRVEKKNLDDIEEGLLEKVEGDEPVSKRQTKEVLLVKNALNIGGIFVASFYLNTRPIIGAGVSTAMSLVAIATDYYMYTKKVSV